MMSFEIRSRPAERGFTLVEILVTVVLISVGLLGVAAMQLTTLRGNQDSYVRTQANVLANDILDRMRANPLQFRDNRYQVALNGVGDVSQRAGQDLQTWQQDIDRLLPGTAAEKGGRVDRTPDAASRRQVVTITIQWRERGEGRGAAGAGGELRTFQTRSEI